MMFIDWKKNPYHENWWDEEIGQLVVHINISRNDVVLFGVVVVAIIALCFGLNWDTVFGFRPK
jgi:hypothetical protein